MIMINSNTQILIKDLKFYGFHGVYPEEQIVGTTFRADAVIDIDPNLPGFSSDRLDDTVNYETIVERIIKIGTTQKYKLIEKLAQTMAESLLQMDSNILAVDITIYKSVNRLTPEPQWIGIHRRVQK